MNIKYLTINKLASASFLALTLTTGLLTPSVASAITANGYAELTLNQAAMATFHGLANRASADVNGSRYMYLGQFHDQTFDYSNINFDPLPLSQLATQAQPFILPVNNGSLPAGNVLTTYDSVTAPSGSIGLGGALRMRSDLTSPTGSVIWGELSLNQSASGVWTLNDNLNGASIFELKPSSVVLGSANGALSLSGDLIFGATSGWGNFLQLTSTELANTVVGQIKLVPSAVPVPAAAWLFGSALIGLTGYKRRTGNSLKA